MDIKPKFCEKYIIHRKSYFDENVNDEITYLVQDFVWIEYFICPVDQSISFIETRFEQIFKYEAIFVFYLNLKILKL